MTFVIDKEAEKELRTFKEKCARCVKGPNLLKTLVVAGCLIVVVQQISVCVNKLVDSPITTYTHFDFNKTVVYPSITLCREPAYKYDKLLDYGLYSHPRYTSTWINFNFSAVSLDQLWDEITYNEKDFFVQYGLDGHTKNIHRRLSRLVPPQLQFLQPNSTVQTLLCFGLKKELRWYLSCGGMLNMKLLLPEFFNYHIDVELTPTLGFVTGRCFTLTPRVLSRHASRSTGYSITLRHRALDFTTSSSVHPPGYHVYVHYYREPFTEVEVYNGGLVDYFYINTGETIDAKLTVDEYVKLPKDHDPCTNLRGYSTNECTAEFVWLIVSKQAGCSGPWMRSRLPHFSNYTAMRNLITAYMSTYNNHGCRKCPRFCRSYLYNAFVTDRQSFYAWDQTRKKWHIKTGDSRLQTQLFIYFNSMMVSVYEERYNYDWNLFMSDLGGNIGFLLGLSVISLTSIIGSLWFEIIKPLIAKKKIRKDIMSVTSSTLTADVAIIYKDENFKLTDLKRLTMENNLH